MCNIRDFFQVLVFFSLSLNKDNEKIEEEDVSSVSEELV